MHSIQFEQRVPLGPTPNHHQTYKPEDTDQQNHSLISEPALPDIKLQKVDGIDRSDKKNP